jgi:SAM-dependent methyltransferase
VNGRAFLVRATASASYRLGRLSSRLEAPRAAAGDAAAERTLEGEREVEWAWCIGHIRPGPGRVLDFGSGNGMIALGASLAGNESVAVDLERQQYLFHGNGIEYVQGDFLQLDFEPRSFDQIVNCSSIEHVGLAGRYGSADRPDGDLEAMAKLAGLLRPGGEMVLAIPLGQDAVFAPWHRVYGEERLSLLLERWTVTAESYWAKVDGEKYEPVARAEALADVGSATYYALGLYVVVPR